MANKALLVGINTYKMPGSDLQGCVNDITNIREVLLDACHSGTGTREAAALAMLPAEHSFKSRFMVPPIDILCRGMGEEDLPLTRIMKATNPTNHALFSGCRDNQTSADAFIGGTYNGAFTYYLSKHREIKDE